jgi:hypothetical protein
MFGNRVWYAIMREGFEEASTYCSKENNIRVAIGVRPTSAAE